MKPSSMLKPNAALALLAAEVALSGCFGEPTKLASETTGDLSNPRAERARFDEEVVASCGAGQAINWVGRKPYLQQVSSTSAEVVFTTESTGELLVDVTTPEGTAVQTLPATVDDSVGANQRFVRIDGLAPETTYCYAVRGATEPTGFVTAPESSTLAPVRFVAFGDSGSGGPNQRAVAEQMQTVQFDFIVHTGDLAYEDGTLGQLEHRFFDVYAPMLRSFAAFPSSGNHDYRTQSAAPFRQVFMLPENGGTEGRERWYSFDWGDVHFVALDTERTDATQAEWLDRDLAATDRPWRVVYGHKPPYSSGEHGSDGRFRDFFVPVIQRHGVQLVLSGHEHDYERTKPLNGVTYVVTGGGGKSSRSVGWSNFTAFAEGVLHFVYVELSETELLLHAIDGVGREFDSAKISLSSQS